MTQKYVQRYTAYANKLPRRNAKGQYSSIRPVVFLILLVLITLFLILNRLLNAPLTSPCPEKGCFVSQVSANEGRFTRDTNPVLKAIHQQFDQVSYDVGDEAVLIAICESSLNPKAKNRHSTASGLFQILQSTWKHYNCYGDIFDAQDNARCAVKIYESTNDWRQWECKI